MLLLMELGFSSMNFLSISSFSSSMLLLAFSLCSSESLKVLIFTAHIKLMFLTAQKVYGMDLLVQQKGMLLTNH